MFKTAAAKIAHNSTLPSLGGNQDLRPLQDLINAEKAVLISLQKLSVDYSRASEALRTWGLNEGDDLGDILSASTTVLNHFSSALSQYASHGHAMRDQLKTIRTREEALEDLRRRRRSVAKNAEAADKKLSKMSPEHKNLGMQTELLNRLRDEIRTMDSDIMTEEAALGDFKRSATRSWMGLKFGGLLECCEKGTVAAEFGKMLIAEISEEMTQPGLPRSGYYGHSKIENYVAEAHRCVNEIQLSTVPSEAPRERPVYGVPQASQQVSYQPQHEPYMPGSAPYTPIDAKPQPLPPRASNELYSQRPYMGNDAPATPQGTSGPSFSNQQQPWNAPQIQEHPNYHPPEAGYSRPLSILSGSGVNAEQQHQQHQPQQHQPQPPSQTMDDFGMNTRSAGMPDVSNPSGGRFATFPVKMRTAGPPASNFMLQDPPSLTSRQEQEDKSFSASIAEALDTASETATDGTNRAASSRWGGSGFAANDAARSSPPQIPWSPPSEARPSQQLPNPPASPPPPAVAIPSTLPPGAAAPNLSNPWNDSVSDQATGHTREISGSTAKEDALLAYMTSAMGDDEHEPHSPGLRAATHDEEQQRISRHVRFGETQDASEETAKRDSPDQGKPVHERDDVPSKQEPVVQREDEKHIGPVTLDERKESDDSSAQSKHNRIPPPTVETETDEKALDAAAARQISLELENLPSPPSAHVELEQSHQVEPLNFNRAGTAPLNVDRGRLPSVPHTYNERASVAPLQPQAMSYAQRNVSPHPYAEINVGAPAPYANQQYSPTNQGYNQSYQGQSPYGSPPNVSPAQAYAQSFQSSHLPKTPDSQVPTSTIPPRFQALNQGMETQIPPRFQTGRAHSPGVSITNQVPPRFQSNSAAGQMGPGPMSLEPQDMSRLTPMQGPETPFRTPPEYPRLGASPSPFARSTASLTPSSGGTAPSGARTISAAAFKRPRNASVEQPTTTGAQGDPYAKRALPASPYPPVRENTLPSSMGERPHGAGLAAPPPGAARPKSEFEEDEYDYISAYVNTSNPGSPSQGHFPPQGQGGPGPYNDGRFGGNMEHDGSLR